MTRIAVLSDVHGNLPALEAVLADIEGQGTPDVYWILGDLGLYFPWSAEVIDQLRALPGAAFLQGNIDRYLWSGSRPAIPIRAAEGWTRAPALLAVREARFRWAVERLSFAQYCFLRDLPGHLALDFPGYGRIMGVHATPGSDETALVPDSPDDEIRPHLAGVDARLLLFGHTHRPTDRRLDGLRLVNPGSVGLPRDGNSDPAYALLEVVLDRCQVRFRRVPYDLEATVDQMEALDFPAWRELARVM